MNVLIIGSGGREYAICKKLHQSKCNLFYYGTHNNPGMDEKALLLAVGNLRDINKISQLALENKIDLVIVGPEIPLSLGLVDKLLQNNIKAIGPTQKMALIESSKKFARQLMFSNDMGKYCPNLLHIISPEYDYDKIKHVIETIMDQSKIVIKPDGICGGKGVMVQDVHFETKEEAIKYCSDLIAMQQYVLIEEKLIGEEFTIMSFSDGVTLKHMIPVKDYKRLYDNDTGPNTGSMGSITGYDGKLWFLTDEDIEISHKINEDIIGLLKTLNGELYKGIIYGSFMKTIKKEIKVIEFNSRFGDPECINIMSLLETDLLDIFNAICNQELDKITLTFNKNASVFKYKVPTGYPDNGSKGEIIYLNELSDLNNNMIYASMTKIEGNAYVTTGSRTFGIIGTGVDITQVCLDVNELMDKTESTLFYRKDIGNALSLSYKSSGVNIEEKTKALKKIEKYITSTYNNDVISQFGDFAGIIRFGNNQSLITSTDGIGTKSILILEQYGYQKGFEMLGNDLVNLNINDILVKGAQPLFFLDYFGCGKLDSNHLKYFIKGVTDACKKTGCALLKGETAQMPDIYCPDTFDLVGTIVGYCDESMIINSKNLIMENDVVIGLASNGPHTNGFSLIRKILDRTKLYENIGSQIIDSICAPHKCYYDDLKLLKTNQIEIHGLCHITGGGLTDNPSRVLPSEYDIQYYDWKMNPVFDYLKQKGHLDDNEMKSTFNCGIGMMIIIPERELNKINKIDGFVYNVIGKVIKK